MTSIIKFEGIWGIGEETPHCYLLTIDDFGFLLDCGWDEKFDKDYVDRLAKVLPRVDCVLLSYPDPLHIGALPYLVGKCQLSCPVYATTPVVKLGQMFLYDLYQSHQNNDNFDNFTLDDVDSAFEMITQVKYNQSIVLRGKGFGISIMAQAAGHILGGSIWRISKDGEEDIIYAVDFNHKKERHLGGCDLDKISRPSLLITDAFETCNKQERRRQRDEKFVGQIQETCRGGGNVLVATDTGGRVLEIVHMLEQMWSTRDSGLSVYSLAMLSNTGYHVVHFARQMIEWMSDKLTKSFDTSRSNPFSLKNVRFCHNLHDLNSLPSPKVVLASFPDLECGFSRDLFIQWASNPKNTIILTSKTGTDTLGRRLIDNPQIRTFKLLEKRRVRLEGVELEDHLKKEKKKLNVIKQERMVESSSDSEEEEDKEQQDIVVVHEKLGRKRHPMFPFSEEKVKSDEYGEFVNLDKFDSSTILASENKENVSQLQLSLAPQDDILEIEDNLTKCVSQLVTVRVAAQVHFIDFDGRSDGESIRKIIEAMHPRRIILVRGSPNDLNSFALNIQGSTKAKIYIPALGQEVNASSETQIYQVRLSESFVSALKMKPAGREAEVAWVDARVVGTVEGTEEDNLAEQDATEQLVKSAPKLEVPDFPTLVSANLDEVSFHTPVFVNDVRLSDFKQVLSRVGINSEFNAGILWCANGRIALRRLEAGHISIEGPICTDYYEIRELLYSQYAIV